MQLALNDHALVKRLVQSVLEHRMAYDWSLQGFGMLRTYISKELRLHVWDSRYRTLSVSDLHTHPWSFDSLIVAGQMQNRRWSRISRDDIKADIDREFLEHELRCGTGGGLTHAHNDKFVTLAPHPWETYQEGETYHQRDTEIHQSSFLDGTVTLIYRTFNEDEDHASVFVPTGQEWISAEPRPATGLEVMDITRQALHKWFTPNPNYSQP